MTKVDAMYSTFEAFEEQLAHCYFLLHERFITNPPVAKFWVEAAMDELQHCTMLRFCREHGSTVTDFEVDARTIEHIDDLLDLAKDIVSAPHFTVDEAFYASLLIESSELDDIYERLTRGLAKDHPLLHQAIHASLKGHYDNFAAAAEDCCRDKAMAEAFRAFGKLELQYASGKDDLMNMKMKRVGLFYATREGQTRRIAEYVADRLRARGFEAEVRNLADGR
jgi:hypothetical protein